MSLAKHVKPPKGKEYFWSHLPKVFLAGSIEMGKATPWQEKVYNAVQDYRIVVLNPRREDWDSSWVQSIDNPQFKEQVLWEYVGMRESDVIFFYFEPGTKSPISLYELGLSFHRPTNELVIVCPEGYWRKGNIDVYCDYEGLPVYSSLEDGIQKLKEVLNMKILASML